MKILIFLLFIVFTSSQIIGKRLINRNACLGGKIEKGKCLCPNNTALIGYECKPCIGGSIMFGRCRCPQGKYLVGNNCTLFKAYSNYNDCTIGKNKCKVRATGGNIEGLVRLEGKIKEHVLGKPVIYLYPEETMDISVKLNIKNSEFTTIYPRFNEENTWNVRAKPNGDILINDRKYPYLFWEALSYNSQETNEGFIITEENAEQFLEEKLKILGLNDKEKTDFITFWLPVLLRNKLSLCSFQTKKFFENYELNVTPKPDSMIRIFLTIKKLDKPINIKEQKLAPVERKGFTVIEWGGTNLLKN